MVYARQFKNNMKRLAYHPFFIRLLHWEYWNSKIIYAPLYPYWLWLSIKARSLYFLTAANPSIRNGGFIMERKSDVYNLLPAHTYPKTVRFEAGISAANILDKITSAGITYPFIAKPDIGERGLAVKKINDEAALETYAQHMSMPFLVQEYIDYPYEAGIFYYRPHDNETGSITGIVNKEPVTVKGDGIHTVAQLVKQNKRYILQWKQINELNCKLMHHVPAEGEEVLLVPYGNHSRGSLFTDISQRATPQLCSAIDNICRNIPGFHYGRLDIKFRDWESLERGEDIAIIELNGSGSEPTHIYDPQHSIFFAWREIIRHWDMLYAISKENNKRGVGYLSFVKGMQEINLFKKIEASLSARIW